MRKDSLIKFLFVVVLPCLFGTSCEPEADLFTRFTMKKGEHYSTPRLVQSLQSDRLLFHARFDASAMYAFEDESFQDAKNKLLGFSDCNAMHHENSARFVWMWMRGKLEIFAYCYVNGVREEKYIGTVETGSLNEYEIRLTDDAYIFRLNSQEEVHIGRGAHCDKGVYYILWPYFGGTKPAPHDVHVDVRIF